MDEMIGIRNHWSYVLEQIGGFLVVIVAMLFSMLDSMIQAAAYLAAGHIVEGLLGFAVFFVVLIIVAFIGFRRWLKTTMTVRDGVITIRRDTLFKKVKNINITNISNINLERNLFELFMGTYKLKIDTSSTTEAASTDLLMVFKKDRAEEIRTIIMDMVRKAKEEERLAQMDEAEREAQLNAMNALDTSYEAAGGDLAAVSTGNKPIISDQTIKEAFAEENFDITYSAKEFLTNAIVNTSLTLMVIIIAGLVAIIIAIVTFAVSGIAGFGAAAGSVLVGVFTFFSIVLAQIKSWESDVNFRSTRREDSILVNTGFITRMKYTIPLAKINAIKINASFLGVLTNRARVDVVNIGGDAGDNTGHRILLYDKNLELKRKLGVLIPELVFPAGINYKKQPINVLVRNLLCVTFWYALIYGCGYFFLNVIWSKVDLGNNIWIIYGVSLAVYALTILGNVMSYKRRGIYYDEKYLIVVNGVFSRSIEIIPYERIQQVHYNENPFYNMFGVKSATITIQGSLGMTAIGTGQFDKNYYEGFEKNLKLTY